MHDHLDDPTPPEGDRAAVAARAGRLRLRRRLVLAGTGTTTALLLVVALALVGQGGAPHRSVLSLASPSTSATPEETPSGTASPSAVAAPTPTASAARTHLSVPVAGRGGQQQPGATTSVSPPCESTKYEECRDGKPGYGDGQSLFDCHNRTTVPAGDTTAELRLGASLELVLPASVKGEGESTQHGPTADLVVHNNGGQALRVTLRPNEGYDGQDNDPPAWIGLVKGAAVEGSRGPEADPPPPITRDLAPGTSVTFVVYLQTFECGDTQDDLGPALPPGDYALGFTVGADVDPIGDPGPSATADPEPSGPATLGGTLHIT